MITGTSETALSFFYNVIITDDTIKYIFSGNHKTAICMQTEKYENKTNKKKTVPQNNLLQKGKKTFKSKIGINGDICECSICKALELCF